MCPRPKKWVFRLQSLFTVQFNGRQTLCPQRVDTSRRVFGERIIFRAIEQPYVPFRGPRVSSVIPRRVIGELATAPPDVISFDHSVRIDCRCFLRPPRLAHHSISSRAPKTQPAVPHLPLRSHALVCIIIGGARITSNIVAVFETQFRLTEDEDGAPIRPTTRTCVLRKRRNNEKLHYVFRCLL